MLIDPKMLDELAQRLANALPAGVHHVKDDMEKNFRAILQTAFNKMNLVTREEFDVQTEVLARTRAKLEVLESKVEELERKNQQAPAG